MAAIANNPKFAKRAGVPRSVGEDFMRADKRTRRYADGGSIPLKSKPKSISITKVTVSKGA